MNDLVVLVPSRGRPENARRLVNAVAATKMTRLRLVFGLDSDDPSLESYLRMAGRYPWVDFTVRTGLRGVVGWLNVMALMHQNSYRFIGTLGDDNVPSTKGWDLRVISSLDRQRADHGMGMCFGDDCNPGRPRGSLCCHVFMTANIIRSLGYMGVPELKHQFVDDAWMAWGRATSIEYLPDVVMEHLHPSVGKAESDLTYREADLAYPADHAAMSVYLVDRLAADIAKLRRLAP